MSEEQTVFLELKPGLLVPVPKGFKPTPSPTSVVVALAEVSGMSYFSPCVSPGPSPGRCSRLPKADVRQRQQEPDSAAALCVFPWEEGWDLVLGR